MPIIDEMFAFVTEERPGDEGVMGFLSGAQGQWIPLVGADMERIESLRSMAMGIAQSMNLPLRLKKFKLVETEVIKE